MNRSDMSIFLAWLLWRTRRGCSVGAILRFVVGDVVAVAPGNRAIRGLRTCRCSRIHSVLMSLAETAD